MMPKANKSETIRVNLSTPFVVRARCKFCSKLPSIYYYTRNPVMWYSPKMIQDQTAWCYSATKRLCYDYYLMEEPKSFNSTKYFSYVIPCKSYRPRLHRTRGSNPILDFVEYLTCGCGRTTWALSDYAIKNRPEISNRKARKTYPHKFEY